MTVRVSAAVIPPGSSAGSIVGSSVHSSTQSLATGHDKYPRQEMDEAASAATAPSGSVAGAGSVPEAASTPPNQQELVASKEQGSLQPLLNNNILPQHSQT